MNEIPKGTTEVRHFYSKTNWALFWAQLMHVLYVHF